mmetsp:Transcript_39791/g.63653  ORF Transcript_39791/g.63653 Transcript_39791/m.63653 type:complete len:215 (+) Transcript_39791:167-811(+)
MHINICDMKGETKTCVLCNNKSNSLLQGKDGTVAMDAIEDIGVIVGIKLPEQHLHDGLRRHSADKGAHVMHFRSAVPRHLLQTLFHHLLSFDLVLFVQLLLNLEQLLHIAIDIDIRVSCALSRHSLLCIVKLLQRSERPIPVNHERLKRLLLVVVFALFKRAHIHKQLVVLLRVRLRILVLHRFGAHHLQTAHIAHKAINQVIGNAVLCSLQFF